MYSELCDLDLNISSLKYVLLKGDYRYENKSFMKHIKTSILKEHFLKAVFVTKETLKPFRIQKLARVNKQSCHHVT